MIDIKEVDRLVRKINSTKKKIENLLKKWRKISEFDTEGQEAFAKLHSGLSSELSTIENEAIKLILG